MWGSICEGWGFVLPLDDMEPRIWVWDDWMSARGDFCDHRDTDTYGRVYEVHRQSLHPAMRVCREWGSLLLNEQVKVVCENQTSTIRGTRSHLRA